MRLQSFANVDLLEVFLCASHRTFVDFKLAAIEVVIHGFWPDLAWQSLCSLRDDKPCPFASSGACRTAHTT